MTNESHLFPLQRGRAAKNQNTAAAGNMVSILQRGRPKTADAPKRGLQRNPFQSLARSLARLVKRGGFVVLFYKVSRGKISTKRGRKEGKGGEKVDQNPFPTVFAQFCSEGSAARRVTN